MEVFCTAIDEFEAETIIVDLMGAGLTDNDITVRLPEKPGGIAISVHADDFQRAAFVKTILSIAGGQEIGTGNEDGAQTQNPPESSASEITDVGGILTYRRQYP